MTSEDDQISTPSPGIRPPSFVHMGIELRRLRGLAAACQFSFEAAIKELKRRVRSGIIDQNSPIVLDSNPAVEVSGNHYALTNRLEKSVPKYVREAIFVRLVSTFELFLVDVVRDVFLRRTDLFMDQDRVLSITYSEALSANARRVAADTFEGDPRSCEVLREAYARQVRRIRC
jgi:hypothetical protein